MKVKSTLATILMAGILPFVNAQTVINVNVDVNQKKIEFEKHKIDKDQSFRIQVHGINSLLHVVKYKVDNYVLESTAPSSLASIFPSVSSSININNIIQTDSSDIVKWAKVLEEVQKLDRKKLTKQGAKAECNRILQMCLAQLNISKKDQILYSLQSISNTYKAYYEARSAQNTSISDSDQDLATELANSANMYQNIKSAEVGLYNTIKILLDGSKNGVVDSTQSGLYLSKYDLSVATIYVINRFNPKDTLLSGTTDLFVSKKLKLDFSVGIGINNLVDNKYYFTYDAGNAKNGIGKESATPLDLGLISLLQLDYQLGRYINLGPAAGISISTFNSKPRYLIGLGFGVGRERSITLSGGLSFGNVVELSNQVSDNGADYNNADLSRFESVPTTERFLTGWYASITYNLTRKRVKK